MKKENKKPILSKRVIICLVIVSFLIITAIFVTIISREDDNSSSDSFDSTLNESNLSETEENGDGNLFGDKILGIPSWIWMIITAVIAYRIIFGDR